MATRKCINCNKIQAIKLTELYQDIAGKYAICKSCNHPFGVELSEKEFNLLDKKS